MDWMLQLEMGGFGLLAGVLGGLLGIGGGIIYVLILPAALLKMGVQPDEIVAFTIANSLFSTVFTTLSGNIKQAKNQNFHTRPVLIISIAGITTSILLLQFFVNSLYYSAQLFNFFFLVILGYMMIRLILKVLENRKGFSDEKKIKDGLASLIITGIGSGAVSPLTGLGGGVFIVPVLHSILHFPIKHANAISLGVIGLTAFASSVFNMYGHPISHVSSHQLGFIVFPIVAALSIGGMVGSFIGVEIGRKMKSEWITILFATFLLIVFTKKLLEII